MQKRIITEETIEAFQQYLIQEEKSSVTIEKYMYDIRAFVLYADGKEVTKNTVLAYKKELISKYAARSVNSKLASLNSLLSFLCWEDLKVKMVKIQRQIFQAEEKELSKAEYLRLVIASKNNPRMSLIIQTLCSTGIRVSELQYFTVEAVMSGIITVSCKNKTRNIFVPGKLQKLLLNYAKQYNFLSGMIFRTKGGNPINRSNIWSEMKKLCVAANVNPSKVFPHNLRKLFASTYYGIEKDIAKLADILGHSSIDTTRIYIMTAGTEYRRKIEKMDLII